MFRKILVPLDGSPTAEQAVPVATVIAGATGPGAVVDLLLVHERARTLGMDAAPDVDQSRWREEHRYVEAIAAETRSTAKVMVTCHVPGGDPGDVITSHALDAEVDLIVMTSHGRTGFSRLWLGSVADVVVRRSTVPVLMLRIATPARRRERPGPHFRRILVPLDGSVTSSEILEAAIGLAQPDRGRLVLLRVVPPVPMPTVAPPGFLVAPVVEDEVATRLLADEARSDLDETCRWLVGRGMTNFETHVLVDPRIAHAIVEFAEDHDIDAIAMSTHGRGASRLVVGSIADKVLRGAAVPLLLRRPVEQPEPQRVDTGHVEEHLAGARAD